MKKGEGRLERDLERIGGEFEVVVREIDGGQSSDSAQKGSEMVRVDGEEMDVVNKFKYLGGVVSVDEVWGEK